jgi:hypothetical protein
VKRLVAFGMLALAFVADAAPPDLGTPAASRVTRAFSDAWGYNHLQAAVLEAQRDKIAAELARLAAEKKALEERGRAEFRLDLVAGDTFDERTLDIHRR